MALEQQLEKLNDNLEQLLAVFIETAHRSGPQATPEPPAPKKKTRQSKKRAPKKPKPEETADDGGAEFEDPVTVDMLASQLRLYVTKTDTDRAREVLKRYGASRIPEVKKEDYVDLYQELEGLNNE